MRTLKISFSYENPLRARFDDGFFAALPRSPGVYFMRHASGEILYVGKAKCLRSRISSYRNAKPGQVGENVIELLERVGRIEYELHDTEQRAYDREIELIRALVPPYNIADVWHEEYLFIGLKKEPAPGRLEFCLTTRKEDEKDYRLYGCFTRRSRVKSAYSALLRLLFAASFDRQRFSFPARLTRASPAYQYSLKVPDPETWRRRLHRFFRGESPALLEQLVFRLLENESLPEFIRPGLQEDLAIVADFHRRQIEEAPRGLRTRLVSHEQMRRHIRKSV